ncbi:hypothetical protein D8Y22_20720 [Salinadaptatus halalkaliphilus]|uniref:Proton-conducting membrane transporter n=1 Tax=Salinadaptatus halalkaliphilus TaxID=2419781 RepID=A0A4S3TG33_9EURY|nr:hypothetical protein [Salinadaptatus halalkaliphilus]THE62884.1 hypothetical protein D8Y22_20720 [Salinadaptatus halalkaliphilus]
MTTRPELRLGSVLAPGLLAVALFGLMAAIVLNTGFGQMAGFPDDLSIVSEIGYAMFDLEPLQSNEGAIPDTEPFLAAFLLIAIVLDAALDASLVLAKREDAGEPVSPLSSQGPSGETDATATDGGFDTAASDSSGTDEFDGTPGGDAR